MNVPNHSSTTRLDIGLSREDQDRIQALRKVEKENENRRSTLAAINDWVMLTFTKITLREKVMFYQLLSVMINAGVPIIRALYVLSEQVSNLKLKRVIKDLALNMEEGQTLSIAMEKYGSVFSEAERGMIASGEASGNLNQILKDIAKQAEKSANIVAKVRGAMIYPVSIMTVMFICLFLMLTMVVPKLTELFNQGDKELPSSTQLLLKLSDLAQHDWPFLLAFLVVFVFGFMLVRRSKQGQYSLHLAVLYIPIFGKLIRELMVSRFARLLASLTTAGVPIVKALEINANAVGNDVYKRRIQYAAQDVSQGIPLGENLSQSNFLFPSAVSSMILVGEQTAKINEVSGKIADFYEEEVDTAVASLSKLMEPVILVIMGSMVAFIVAAIMQPIMSISDISTAL